METLGVGTVKPSTDDNHMAQIRAMEARNLKEKWPLFMIDSRISDMNK